MIAILCLGIAMMPNQMKMNLLYLLETMMFRRTMVVYAAGIMAPAAMSIVFALIHTGRFTRAFTRRSTCTPTLQPGDCCLAECIT